MKFLMRLVAILAVASASMAFSEESLKDLSRLPHLQRHWLQRLEQMNKRNKVTTSQPPPIVTTTATTDATEESIEVVEDERVTTANPTKDADAGTRAAPTGSRGGGVITSMLTISEAKEKLKARRIKSRKKSVVNEEQQQQQHQYQYKRTDDIYSPGAKEETIEVKKHIQRMTNATCGKPTTRLIYVHQQHETAPNVRYIPSCTWLHRCSDDIGCCTDNSKTCSASNIESVSLPFFVLTMIGVETKRTITRLSFENHTSCECVGRNSDIMPRTEPDSRPVEDADSIAVRSYLAQLDREKVENLSAKTKKPTDGHRSYSTALPSPSDDLIGDGSKRKRPSHDADDALGRVTTLPASDSARQHSLRPSRLEPKSIDSKRCRCPSHYTPTSTKKKSCVCQCRSEGRLKRRSISRRGSDRHRRRGQHHHHHRCNRLQRGLEMFPPSDRGCIIEKHCQVPTCDYGRYVTLIGRCPRRGERNSSWRRFLS